MKFTKMQGAGNDYIYLDCTEGFPDNLRELAVKLSDRHFGVGGDGLICIGKSDIGNFSMRMFNADGSEGEMCGNGIRCAARYVFDKGLTTKTDLIFETKAGLRSTDLILKNGVVDQCIVDMGEPCIEKTQRITVKGKDYTGTVISMGNPHFIIEVSDLQEVKLNELGPEIENATGFENGINVEFVKVLCKGRIQMKIWERGSGATLACGTGACAAVAALANCGALGRQVEVCMPGGCLDVFWRLPGNHIFLSGPAVTVFEGVIDLANK